MKDEALTRLTNRRRQERQGEKQTWISVGFLKDLTGWDKERIRRAREQNIVRWKKCESGIRYLLESIPEVFIMKKQL